MTYIVKGIGGVVVAIYDKENGRGIAANAGPETDIDPASCDYFEDATRTVKVGDAYDVKETRFNIMHAGSLQKVILTMLFQTINDVRVLKGQQAYTAAQFKTYVKNQIT